MEAEVGAGASERLQGAGVAGPGPCCPAAGARLATNPTVFFLSIAWGLVMEKKKRPRDPPDPSALVRCPQPRLVTVG